MRLLAAVLLLALMPAGGAGCACECQRGEPVTPAGRLEHAAVAFTGTVVRTEMRPDALASPEDVLNGEVTTLAVDSVWKGDAAERRSASMTVYSSLGGSAMCGVEWAVGQRYVVYARAEPARPRELVTSWCFGTARLPADSAARGAPSHER